MPSYVLNPCASVTATARDAGLDWSVEAPVRGEGLRRSVIRCGAMPGVERLFTSMLHGGDTSSVDDATVARLVSLGVLVPPAAVPRPVRLSARFEEPLWSPCERPADLRINRHVRLEVVEPSGPLEAGTVAVVRDPVRDLELPYWLDAAQEDAVRAVVARVVALDELDAALVDGLVGAGVLYEPTATRNARRRKARADVRARAELAATGLCRIDDALPGLFVAALRRYLRATVAEGHLALGDSQVHHRYAAHDEPVAGWLHERLTPLVASLASEPIERSYAYVAAYLPGAVLVPHRDRDQCQYTLSLAVDATPADTREGAWPLLVESAAGGPMRSVRMRPGDAALFRGTDLAHAREPLPDGCAATTMLFHFVPVP